MLLKRRGYITFCSATFWGKDLAKFSPCKDMSNNICGHKYRFISTFSSSDRPPSPFSIFSPSSQIEVIDETLLIGQQKMLLVKTSKTKRKLLFETSTTKNDWLKTSNVNCMDWSNVSASSSTRLGLSTSSILKRVFLSENVRL